MNDMLHYARFTMPGIAEMAEESDMGDHLARVAGLPQIIATRLQDAAVVLELWQVDANALRALPKDKQRPGSIARVLGLAFLDALAGAQRALRTLGKLENNAAVTRHVAEYDAAFPDLVDLRDSIEHEDDRMRWRERRGRHLKMRTHPPGHVPSGEVADETGVWMVHFRGNSIAATCADGRMGRLEVSEANLKLACDIVQRVFDAASGDRPGRHEFPIDLERPMPH